MGKISRWISTHISKILKRKTKDEAKNSQGQVATEQSKPLEEAPKNIPTKEITNIATSDISTKREENLATEKPVEEIVLNLEENEEEEKSLEFRKAKSEQPLEEVATNCKRIVKERVDHKNYPQIESVLPHPKENIEQSLEEVARNCEKLFEENVDHMDNPRTVLPRITSPKEKVPLYVQHLDEELAKLDKEYDNFLRRTNRMDADGMQDIYDGILELEMIYEQLEATLEGTCVV